MNFIADGSLLEESKENIVPNPHGHSAISLQYAIQHKNDYAKEKAEFLAYIQSQKESQEYEDDPLDLYYQYIKFLQEFMATGAVNYPDWMEGLELVTKAFVDDKRYVYVWCLYAKCCIKPEEVFEFMQLKGIGECLSIFYEKYAEYLAQRLQRYNDALNILDQGIKSKASPLKRLVKTHAAFSLQISQIPTESKKRTIQGIMLDMPNQGKKKQSFTVFQDEKESYTKDNTKNSWFKTADIFSNELLHKLSVPWMGVKIPQKRSISVVHKPPSFAVYNDTQKYERDAKYFSAEEKRAEFYFSKKETLVVKEAKKMDAVPSPTIHTKEALKDIMGMFNDEIETKEETKEKIIQDTPNNPFCCPVGDVDEQRTRKKFKPSKFAIFKDAQTPVKTPTKRGTLEICVNLSTKQIKTLKTDITVPKLQIVPVDKDVILWNNELIQSHSEKVLPLIKSDACATFYECDFIPFYENFEKMKSNSMPFYFKLDNHLLYAVQYRIGEGGFASVFMADQEITTPTSMNANSILTSNENMHVPIVKLFQGHFFNRMSCLSLEYLEHGTILDSINAYRAKGNFLPEQITAYYSLCLIRMIKYLIQNNPENILVRFNADTKMPMMVSEHIDPYIFDLWFQRHELVLIDFGRSIDLDLYSPTTKFNVFHEGIHEKGSIENLVSAFQKIHKSWQHEVDFLGIGNSIHCLLSNDYPDLKLTPNRLDFEFILRRSLKYPWEVLLNKLMHPPSDKGESLCLLNDLEGEWSIILNSECLSKPSWRQILRKHEIELVQKLTEK
ncbi:Mitotic checkpoint serine/threonine protein kinase Bub1/Mad3-like protein [Rozella allomycis CSF55]|uniref:Mitotic checkpoint serine/threonine protein kinase Bub1/Mad3-like protein n=1 Tax=Rozella allomycis (strain CSF55) TaxID=988480 RepID=A0A075ARB4_ROZAC|nr:Mitotic checkpoint serine/threonine protein kinase Bub1/Mad3-like protein [Rozella allomycis CSF55]|eukprot:EPZ31256.1 Mitotic checkpoint serine/threonine protein kinase Bub1/Mad3-like protein [Rozella allomycis CSF55]